MSGDESRIDRFEKQRKTRKSLTILIIIGSVLLLFLIGTFIFGGNDTKNEIGGDTEKSNKDLVIEESDNDDESNDDETSEENQNEEEDKNNDEEDTDDIDKESVKSSDENVSEAFKANWKPVNTKQDGEHTTQFKKGSQDWAEMEEAASSAAEISLSHMVTWRIENGGAPDKAIATISEDSESQVYRVYISWIDQEGWKPTKVELLKENDKN